MHEDVKNVGQLFKAKRQEANLSLKEVENATSIRSGYVKAIEEGHFDQFLSSIYVMGFIRQYAIFLGLDVDKMMQDYPEAFKLPQEPHEFSYGIGSIEVRGNSAGSMKWIPNVLWGSIGAGILVLAWYLAKYLEIF